jgi:hypothetical protein
MSWVSGQDESARSSSCLSCLWWFGSQRVVLSSYPAPCLKKVTIFLPDPSMLLFKSEIPRLLMNGDITCFCRSTD